MKGSLSLAAFALLMAWLAYVLVRSAAASPQSGRDLVGYALAVVSAVLLLVAAARVATSRPEKPHQAVAVDVMADPAVTNPMAKWPFKQRSE
jgi:hypothetical protein